jgi:hypothetical protein
MPNFCTLFSLETAKWQLAPPGLRRECRIDLYSALPAMVEARCA